MKSCLQTNNIRPFHTGDFFCVQRIYQQGINTGNATFQTTVKSLEEWEASMHSFCRLVAEIEGVVVGWAGLSPISSREVYSGVSEVSVYVDTNFLNKGIGNALLRSLILASENQHIWMLQASIFPENNASISLHKKLGFNVVGTRKKLGKMAGNWRDVVLMERRSSVVGID